MNENKNQSHAKRAEPCIMVIFGATGDLAKRKLLPALYNLAKQGFLPEEFAFVGFARQTMSQEEHRKKIVADLNEFAIDEIDEKLIKWFEQRAYFIGGDFDDPETFAQLEKLLPEIDEKHKTLGNYFFYMATPPQLFAPTARKVSECGLAAQEKGNWRRFIFEKPFGRDLESAKSLNTELAQFLSEQQIYRIDHYLGKETVQNILVFRFGNGIFEPIWNRNYIDHVQITVAERLGVEGRGGYYETAGALRDMIPNHIFQLITLTAMEPPVSFDADAVRDEQAKILHAIQPFTPEEVLQNAVRGQYSSGEIDGKTVQDYRHEKDVSLESKTETYAAMKISIDNWRWANVPFYVRTGKHLPARDTEICVQFKRAPFVLFRDTSVEKLTTNRLIIHIQPNEGITLHFGAKIPGPVVNVGAVDMDFNYIDHFGKTPSTGYERLLYDCMIGDATLFQRADMVESSWNVVSPVLDVWQTLPARNFPNYTAGTWGPKEADELLQRDGRKWRETDSRAHKS
ncbi:MAG: glucose-6-phosphate dehydrogenase [Pyrinomonadaceae bacterium]|nr:glucose-6-phosphate dehydrogenase [Pyrinomonadaceae bacterium]